MQTAARPAMARDQENVAPAAKAKQHAASELEKKKKYVGVLSSRQPRRDDPRASLHPLVADRLDPRRSGHGALTVTTFAFSIPSSARRDRPKEVKCPRVVTETYKDARTGETRTRSYVRGRPLGKGGFAVVYSMQDPSTGESFAAKVVAKSTLQKDRARRKILTEIRIHRGVDNAHVVKFKKCFEDDENVYILMELCSDKTLADVVKRRGRLTESECAPYAREIVAAVAHLHRDCGVIHRDLKLGNLFLTPAGLDEALSSGEGGPGMDEDLGADPSAGTRLKIGDFGLACVVERDGDRKLTICGTPNYIAPEVLAGSKGGGHSFEVDVWSIGVILYALLVGTPPFQTSDVRATYKRIRANAYEFPKKDDGSGEDLLSRRAMDLISQCLAPKPADRPSVEAIANHPLCRIGAPEWRLPERATKKTRDPRPGGAAAEPMEPKSREARGRTDSRESREDTKQTLKPLAPRAAALLAAKRDAPAPRAPLSPLPANLPARAPGRMRANRSATRSETIVDSAQTESVPASVSAPPAHPASFDVLEAQDVVRRDTSAADSNAKSVSIGAKPRRAAEEGAPTRASASQVPSAPPASPRAGACVARRDDDRFAGLGFRVRDGRPTEEKGPNTAKNASVRAAPSAAALTVAGGESSSSLADAADDDADADADVEARSAAAATLGGSQPGDSAASTSAPSPSALIDTFPPVWVTKWVDYTSKYGLGYRLSDGTFGVVFNDATKMSQESATEISDERTFPSGTSGTSEARDPAGDRLEYRERARRGSGSNQGRRGGDARAFPGPPPCVAFSASAAPPAGLEKKTKLMRHFRGYLARDGRSAVERSAGGLFDAERAVCGANEKEQRDGHQKMKRDVLPRAVAETRAAAKKHFASASSPYSAPYLPHVKNWLRTKHAILFRLSNRTIQVNFTDGSEILLSSEAQACVFSRGKTGTRAAHRLASLPADPELLRRLRYVKEVLHQLVHRA